jgi:hypothetical protein
VCPHKVSFTSVCVCVVGGYCVCVCQCQGGSESECLHSIAKAWPGEKGSIYTTEGASQMKALFPQDSNKDSALCSK